MVIFLYVLAAYFLIGVGFSIAAWLEQAEHEVEKGNKPSPYFSKVGMLFLFGWLAFAIYCYRAEVKRTIPKVNFEELKKSQK